MPLAFGASVIAPRAGSKSLGTDLNGRARPRLPSGVLICHTAVVCMSRHRQGPSAYPPSGRPIVGSCLCLAPPSRTRNPVSGMRRHLQALCAIRHLWHRPRDFFYVCVSYKSDTTVCVNARTRVPRTHPSHTYASTTVSPRVAYMEGFILPVFSFFLVACLSFLFIVV